MLFGDLPHGLGSGTHGKHAQHRSACNQSVLQYDRSARSSVCITPHLQALCPLTLIQKSKRSKQKSQFASRATSFSPSFVVDTVDAVMAAASAKSTVMAFMISKFLILLRALRRCAKTSVCREYISDGVAM